MVVVEIRYTDHNSGAGTKTKGQQKRRTAH